jgi:hypothetical protein
MTPVDLEELAARVEIAAGADRELDGAIHVALYPDSPASGFITGRLTCKWWKFGAPHGLNYETDNGGGGVLLPGLTASLDAVVRLIEEKLPGYSWEVRRSGFGTPSQAQLWDPMKAPPMSIVARVSVETTPARALLAAALRAMKEEGR